MIHSVSSDILACCITDDTDLITRGVSGSRWTAGQNCSVKFQLNANTVSGGGNQTV